jgi:hypothetical protein
MIDFVKENDELAARIAERGYNFVKTHLKMKHISCYWNKLLMKYSKLQKHLIKKREDVILL